MVILMVACGDGPSGPSLTVVIDPGALSDLLVGDDATLTVSISEPASFATWRSSDSTVATVSDGFVEALRPGVTWVVASSGGAADSVSVTVIARPGGFTAAQVDYFLEIAFGFEFGGASEIIRKWPADIRIRVNGNPNEHDRTILESVLGDINALTATADMLLVDDEPMVELHFASTSRFPDILSSWVPGNVGYFNVWWDGSQHFTRAVILIATDVDQELRDHLIREEVTQTLGLAQDSFWYAESIFYQLFSTVTRYAPVDEAVIRMLYRPEVLVGMDRSEAGRVVRKLTRQGLFNARSLAALRTGFLGGRPGAGSGSHGVRQVTHELAGGRTDIAGNPDPRRCAAPDDRWWRPAMDKDPMVSKGLSWPFRSLVPVDEVNCELDTGRRNPRP